MWVAVYDILLDWIDPTNKTMHPARFSDLCRPTHVSTPSPPDPTGSKEYALSNAYADDLATITTGPRAYSAQEQQAEWISVRVLCLYGVTTQHAKNSARLTW